MADAPPDKTEPRKPARAATRYLYQRMATCVIEENSFEVQLLNISSSGIQFASRRQISSREPIVIKWTDEKVGAIEPMFVIAREVHKPDVKDFSFYYGAQYNSLSDETKKNLISLLKMLKELKNKEVDQQVQKITPMYLMNVMDQGADFLKNVLDGNAPPYFQTMVAEIKDYEKEAFKHDTAPDKLLQRIALHIFHCELLNILALSIKKDPDLIAIFLQKTSAKFAQIASTENTADIEIKKIISSTYAADVRKGLLQSANESSNRLYYAKQKTIKVIVESLEATVHESAHLHEAFAPILAEFEKMSIAHTPSNAEVEVYVKEKKPEPVKKKQAYTSSPVQKKSNKFLLPVLGIIIFFILIKIIFQFFEKGPGEHIGLRTKILNTQITGHEITLVMDESWTHLTREQKSEEMTRLIAFLKKHPKLNRALLVGGTFHLVQTVTENDHGPTH